MGKIIVSNHFWPAWAKDRMAWLKRQNPTAKMQERREVVLKEIVKGEPLEPHGEPI